MPPQLIDTHQHFWDADLYRYPALDRPGNQIARRYFVDELLADASAWQLLKSVHVQGEIGREHTLREPEWLQAMADERGFPHAIVAYAPLQDPGVLSVLEHHARFANVRGIRQILNPDQCERADYLTDTQWQAGYALLERFGMAFDLQADPEQLPDAASLAARFPGIPVIVNHSGMPRNQSSVGVERWRHGLRLLAGLPHVSIKISGFAMFDRQWTAESIKPFVRDSIDIFGTQRAMFASNFPVDRAWSSWDKVWGAFDSLTQDLSEAERTRLFQTNAERIYRI
jgi:predicted TIM-barrel fold metal-dependent hydrolase